MRDQIYRWTDRERAEVFGLRGREISRLPDDPAARKALEGTAWWAQTRLRLAWLDFVDALFGRSSRGEPRHDR